MFALNTSEEVSLELLEPAHAPGLFALTDASRSHLREWLPWVDGVRTVEDTLAFIHSTQQQWANGMGYQAAIRHRGRLAGVIGHYGIQWAHRRTNLGYWLGEPYIGLGIMTAACRAVCTHAFGTMGLNRVEILCATENRRSRAVPERLGFQCEGTLREAERLNGRYVDHAIYAMLARDWQA